MMTTALTGWPSGEHTGLFVERLRCVATGSRCEEADGPVDYLELGARVRAGVARAAVDSPAACESQPPRQPTDCRGFFSYSPGTTPGGKGVLP
jgi:hypothetical protein